METVSRKVYYRDNDFSLEFEPFGGDLLLHCTVKRFTPAVAKQGILVFGMFLNEAMAGGFERVFTVTPNPKFAKMFGGVPVNTVSYIEKEYEVIEWDLQHLL